MRSSIHLPYIFHNFAVSPTLSRGTGTWQPCHAECSHKRAWSRDAAHRETSTLDMARFHRFPVRVAVARSFTITCVNLCKSHHLAISCHVYPQLILSQLGVGSCWILLDLVGSSGLPNVWLGVLQSLDRRSGEFRRRTPTQWTWQLLGKVLCHGHPSGLEVR